MRPPSIKALNHRLERLEGLHRPPVESISDLEFARRLAYLLICAFTPQANPTAEHTSWARGVAAILQTSGA